MTDFGLSYGALVEHVAGEMDQIAERHTQMEEAIEQEAETGESGRRQTVSMKRYSEVSVRLLPRHSERIMKMKQAEDEVDRMERESTE